VRIPSVPSTKREDRLRVELTSSPSRRRVAGVCAQRTARVDVDRTLRIAGRGGLTFIARDPEGNLILFTGRGD
jgi:hypothetical protein